MKQIIERVKELLEPIAKERNHYVVDITCKRESGKLVLRIVVDNVSMEGCTRLNNDLSEILDKEDFISQEYTLEVSSPGLDRRLTSDNDFVWATGRNIKVTTYAPIDGKNVFNGILVGLGKDTIVVEENGISTEVPREKIASAKLDANIDWSKK
ncbi:ribosome maturation factor RimP [Candidatus Omnitrophota bacterium]